MFQDDSPAIGEVEFTRWRVVGCTGRIPVALPELVRAQCIDIDVRGLPVGDLLTFHQEGDRVSGRL